MTARYMETGQYNVTTVYKGKGCPDLVNNYRQISLSTTVCKLKGKLIFLIKLYVRKWYPNKIPIKISTK